MSLPDIIFLDSHPGVVLLNGCRLIFLKYHFEVDIKA